MTTNPNFPEHLDINPSAFPQFTSPNHEKLQTTDDALDAAIFGDDAQRTAIKKYGIAGRVWEAAYKLSIYANPPSTMQFDPPFVQDILLAQHTAIELGSGTGMVSLHIAKTLNTSNDTIIVTDLPEVCPLLENNLGGITSFSSPRDLSSGMANVYIRPLSWGDEEHIKCIANEFFAERASQTSRKLSHVICSDLVYFPELLGPLLRTLLHLTSSPFYPHPVPVTDVDNTPVVIISYKIRSLSKETPFWSAFGLWFEFEPVLVKDTALGSHWRRFGQSSDDDTIFVFAAHRRSNSYSWEMPMSDQELLDGRGARGDNAVKGDDTFETLLFMILDES